MLASKEGLVPAEAEGIDASAVTLTRGLLNIISDRGVETRVITSFTEANAVLTNLGITLAPADIVRVGEIDRNYLRYGAAARTIVIIRAPRVAISVDGRTVAVASWAKTVGELLREQGIKLEGLDTVQPEAASAVTEGLSVRVRRVRESDQVVRQVTDYKTILSFDPSLGFWDKQIAQDGQQGIVERTYHVRTEDSVQTLHRLIHTAVAQQLQNLIIVRGARSGRATHYCLPPRSLHCDSLTAARGQGLEDVPMGTKLRVTNHMPGSPYYGRSVDVVINDKCPCTSGAVIDLADAAFYRISDDKRPMPTLFIQVIS